MEPLFFEPVFKEKIWGGTELKDFGYEIPTDKTGECWAISAHPNGPSIVKNGSCRGLSLMELWKENRDLFGDVEGETFPLLTKILDANDNLSIQVHPNDEYAKVNENGELGKTECWYIIACDDDAELIFGHNARSKDELVKMIDEGNWDELLRVVKIEKGDFFYVPSGTVHALCKGTLVLEIQQNSDTTYHLYDYNRTDDQGNLRELHLEKSKDVITIPFEQEQLTFVQEKMENAIITHLVNSDYFSVDKWEISGEASFRQNNPFLLCSVIEGDGKLNHKGIKYALEKGTHFLLPVNFGEFVVEGDIELIVSHV